MSAVAAAAPVTFAVCSTASIAKDKAIPALLAVAGARLTAVSSRSKDRAQAFADAQAPGAGVKGMTHEEVLVEADADVLYIPLPSGVRNAFMCKALESGKHVYSEKPHSGTVAEFKQVLDLAAARGRQWMDGTMWYHSVRTKSMEEALQKLGPVRRVSASFTWGNGLVDQAWIDGGNGRTDPTREPFGMLGDSGHYPISSVAWAFGWELPVKVQACHYKLNNVGAVITCEAFLWFKDGGRAVIDTTCEGPHRSQFEVMCEMGVLKVDDLVGGQGRSGNFAAYESPFVGSSTYVVGDHMGKDTTVEVEACDHENCLVQGFVESVQQIRAGKPPNPEWSRRALVTHTIMCAIFESCMQEGAPVELIAGGSFRIGGETFPDVPTRDWWAAAAAER